jgi:phage terminase large subunit
MPVDANGVLEIATPRVFMPLLTQGKRFYGAKGGRASGKSHMVAELLVEEAIANPGLRVLCVRETQKSLKESAKKLIEDKIEALGVGRLFESLLGEIRGPGGGSFQFTGLQSHNADSIKGYESIDICWAEEASSLSERSIKMLIPTIRAPGSRIYFSWNPRKRSDPVERLIPWSDEARAVLVHANYLDNPFLPRVMLEEAATSKEQYPEDYSHVWLGGYEEAGSRVVIPSLWVNAAVGLAERLGIAVEGKRWAALDVAGAEEGGDENGFIVRHGIEISHVEKWNGLDTSMTCQKAVSLAVAHQAQELDYDSAGVGEGVTGEWAAMGRRGEQPDGLAVTAWNGGFGVQEPDERIDPANAMSPKNKDHYQNLKAQAWMRLRKRFQNAYQASIGQPYDPDEIVSISKAIPERIRAQFCDELSQPEQKLSGTGKLMVDKQPSGTKSPNLADPAAMIFTPLGGGSTFDLTDWL